MSILSAILLAIIAGYIGMAFGCYITDSIWSEKATSGFRRECRGKLYRVTIDQ